MVSVFLLIALAIPVLLVAESPAAMTVFAVLFGLGLGGEYLIHLIHSGDEWADHIGAQKASGKADNPHPPNTSSAQPR